MAISIITGGSLSGNSINGGDILINFPVGVSANDVVYACVGVRGTATINTAGYTQLQTGTSTAYNAKVWRKVMGATPDSSILFTGTGSATDAMAAVVYILRGVDTINPEDTTTPAAATGSSTNPDNPAITTVTRTAWVLPFASSEVNDVAVTAPTGYLGTVQDTGNDTRDSTTAVAYKSVDPAGVENPASWTAWDTGTWVAITVAVRPSGFPVVSVTGVSGTGQVGTVTVSLGVAVQVSVTGVSSAVSAGTVETWVGIQATTTGVSGSGAVGTVIVREGQGFDVSGVSATGYVGDVSVKEGAGASVLGVESTVELGDITLVIPIISDVTGVLATGAVGNVLAVAGQLVRPTGVYCTAQTGTVSIWFGIDDYEAADWNSINDGQVPDWQELPS